MMRTPAKKFGPTQIMNMYLEYKKKCNENNVNPKSYNDWYDDNYKKFLL